MKSLFTLFAALALSALAAVPASAQIIQLGGSDAETKAFLSRQGYDRIDIVARGLSSTTYHACRGADRMQFKVYWDGRVGTADRIGGCRVMITAQEAETILAQQGYERISIEDRAGSYIAVACNNGNRVRINISMQGDLSRERVIGRCEEILTPTDITAKLEREGYDRVRFLDRQLPRYVAEACLGGDRLELVLDRFGEIAQRRRIGACDLPVNPADLPAILASKGLDRVTVTDSRLPRYKAEGCRGANKVEVIVNRFGEITDEVRIGRCQQAINARQLSAILEQQGYSQVRVTDNGNNGFLAVACLNDRRSELVVSRYGEVQREIDLGRCTSMTVQEVLRSLSSNRLRDVKLFAEGCDRGNRLRIDLNEYGEEIGRNRTGRC